jgi:hypothetical protein
MSGCFGAVIFSNRASPGPGKFYDYLPERQFATATAKGWA